MTQVCRYCGMKHSDWFGCETAANLGLVEVFVPKEMMTLEQTNAYIESVVDKLNADKTLPVVCSEPKGGVLPSQTLDVVDVMVTKFDHLAAMRVAAMAHARKFRKVKVK